MGGDRVEGETVFVVAVLGGGDRVGGEVGEVSVLDEVVVGSDDGGGVVHVEVLRVGVHGGIGQEGIMHGDRIHERTSPGESERESEGARRRLRGGEEVKERK